MCKVTASSACVYAPLPRMNGSLAHAISVCRISGIEAQFRPGPGGTRCQPLMASETSSAGAFFAKQAFSKPTRTDVSPRAWLVVYCTILHCM